MKLNQIILTIIISVLSTLSTYGQSDEETIQKLISFIYYSDPTVNRSAPVNNTDVANGIEEGRFWEDTGIDDLQAFVRSVCKSPSNGGDRALQHSIAEVLKLTNRRILVYLWNDSRSLQESQYAHGNKPCLSDYSEAANVVNNRVWPCAWHLTTGEDPKWGGNVHIGQYFASEYGLKELQATFIHEFMHTQDPVSILYQRFLVGGHSYDYGFDEDHYGEEAMPNKRMAYGEVIANVLGLMYNNTSMESYLDWYVSNGNIMVEKQMPNDFFKVNRQRMGFSDDVWLYDQINNTHGPGTPHRRSSRYVTYPIRSLAPKFLIHNEMVSAMALALTSYHVRDIDPFIYAVKEVNKEIVNNQQQDPFALIVNKFALGLTSRGDSPTLILTDLKSNGVQNEPYYAILPLAYFDYFTGYGATSKSEFNTMFNDELDATLLSIYWDFFKNKVRTIPFLPVLSSQSDTRSFQTILSHNLTDISIQCGVNQSFPAGVMDHNFESASSTTSSSASTSDTSAAHSENRSSTASSTTISSESNCQDWPSYGDESSITVNGVTIPVFNANTAQKGNMEQTLSRLPAAHLNSIPRIIIVSAAGPNYFLKNPSRGGASWRCNPSNREDEWIKLSEYSLSERRNQRINFTLLHEVGHFIDRDFNIVSGHQEEARRYLREVNYRGHTQGAGEAIAQGYMYYFATTTAQDRRPRVRDRLPVYLKEILENSSAWSNTSTW